MKTKYFLISIDTEGDNLWNWKENEPILTKNALFLPRFQELCNKFCFKPTYLTNFEMANSVDFINFITPVLKQGNCEIGMHLHAWNTPPEYELNSRNDCDTYALPYITEYPIDIVENKIKTITDLIEKTFLIKPVTHRAGRWATNKQYAMLLEKYGYKYDCSFTPGISWKECAGFTNCSYGNDYSQIQNSIQSFYDTSIIEIPLQGYKNKRIKRENVSSVKTLIRNIIYSFKRKEVIMFRPNGKNLNDLLYIIKKNYCSRQNYLMFMLHSSEFMPGGSPSFKTEKEIEELFHDLEILFVFLKKKGYVGITVKQYGEIISRRFNND